jgi:ribA/ribD-fused uncharacterized protein
MRITDTHVYFYSGQEIYSNFHRCQFKDPTSGLTFHSTEQAFMWYKGQFFNDVEACMKIEKETNPPMAKALGRTVQGYNEKAWECVRLGFMTYVNLLKFEQNADFKKDILSTGSRILVEASPYDRVWGVGLTADDDRILDKNLWTGRNLLGVALMKVRNILADN